MMMRDLRPAQASQTSLHEYGFPEERYSLLMQLLVESCVQLAVAAALAVVAAELTRVDREACVC
jgi:hypothetical protein